MIESDQKRLRVLQTIAGRIGYEPPTQSSGAKPSVPLDHDDPVEEKSSVTYTRESE